MKLKKDLILRQIAGQYMVMPVGRLSQICQLLHISSSAAFIWKVMEKGEFTEDSLVEEALKEYFRILEEELQKERKETC